MKISMCIPCVDKHVELVKCFLDSISYYTKKPDEVIISLSPKFMKLNLNNEKKLIEDKYNFVKCLVQDKITCGGMNLNKCFDIVTGDIIFILGADDILHPQCIEYVSELFQKNLDLKMALFGYVLQNKRDYNLSSYKNISPISDTEIFSDFSLPSGKDKRGPGFVCPPLIINNFNYIDSNNLYYENKIIFSTGALCISKKCSETIKFPNTFSGEDLKFIHDVYRNFKNTIYINKIFHFYCRSGTWIT